MSPAPDRSPALLWLPLVRQLLRQNRAGLIGRQLRIAIEHLVDAYDRLACDGSYLLMPAASVATGGDARVTQNAPTERRSRSF